MPKPAATLNELIAITRDGLDFYNDAIGHVRNPQLKIVFRAMVDAKQQLIAALAEHVRRRGEQPSDEHTFAGSFRKTYADVRALLSGNKDTTYVAQLEQSEDRLLAAFEDAARATDDAHLHKLILDHLPKVRLCHEQMRNLKMSLAA